MPLSIEAKKAVVNEAAKQLTHISTVVVAQYRGIAVGDMTRLRVQAREHKVYLKVLKNTLAKRALVGTDFVGLTDEMTGPLIYSMSEDPVAAAKVLHEFAKTNENLVIKAGNYKGKMLDVAAVKELAVIPAYKDLLAILLGVMKMPVTRMARVLAEIAKKKQIEESVIEESVLEH